VASIVLFHSALGLTTSIKRFADTLTRDGHSVVTPDFFDGETFSTVEDGARKRDALGIPALMERAVAASEGVPEASIYVGFSMGAAAAQFLGLNRPGARGVVLMHAVLPLAAMGADRWPNVPVQVHASEHDPWIDEAALDAFAGTASARVFRYPGAAHLFAEEASADYDATQAEVMLERVRSFVGGD
jgi:dienelactone hydrolase